MPKKQSSDNTPIRSGLRKRKREEAPVVWFNFFLFNTNKYLLFFKFHQQTEPEVKEEWIPEEKLELWEIRAYRDRLERDRNAAVTRTRSGTEDIFNRNKIEKKCNENTYNYGCTPKAKINIFDKKILDLRPLDIGIFLQKC